MPVALPRASALHPAWRLVIDGFFDDSGKQAGSNFVCLAGFLADTVYWSAFLVDWAHLLRKWGIREVHMKNLMSGYGEFTGWNEEKKREAVSDFVECIRKHHLIGYGIAVDAKFWNTLPRDFQKRHGDAQEFCFERIIRRIRDAMVRRHDRDFIGLTFDHDKEFVKPRLTRFQRILDRDPWARETIVHFGFGRAWANPALQAADMLAWETHRLLQVQENGARPSFGSETMFKGPDGIEFSAGEYWDEAELSAFITLPEDDLPLVSAPTGSTGTNQA